MLTIFKNSLTFLCHIEDLLIIQGKATIHHLIQCELLFQQQQKNVFHMLFPAPFCKQKITTLYLLIYECSQWVKSKGTHYGSESNTSPSVTGTQNNQSEDTLDRYGPQHSQILRRNSR